MLLLQLKLFQFKSKNETFIAWFQPPMLTHIMICVSMKWHSIQKYTFRMQWIRELFRQIGVNLLISWSIIIKVSKDSSLIKSLNFSSSSTKTDAWTPQYNYWYRKWFHWFAPRNMVMCWIFEWTSENIRHNEKHKTVRLVSGFLCLHVG